MSDNYEESRRRFLKQSAAASGMALTGLPAVTLAQITAPTTPPTSQPQKITLQRTGVGYSTFALAQAAAVDGDTILIDPGPSPSLQIQKSLTVKCSVPGQFIVINLGGRHGSGLWMGDVPPLNKTITVQGFWIRNSKESADQAPKDGAGIAIPSASATWIIRNCKFDENAVAIGSGRGTRSVTIENCEFFNNGNTSGLCHQVYVEGQHLLIRGCKFYWTYDYKTCPNGQTWRIGIGHELKTRCAVNYIYGNYFHTGKGSTTAKINPDDGGVVYVDGNIIEEGPNSAIDPTDGNNFPDSKIIMYNWSGFWSTNELHVRQNTIVNNGAPNENVVKYINVQEPGYPNPVPSGPPPVVEIKDNVIVGSVSDSAKLNSTLNTITTDKTVLINPAAEQWGLKTPVPGSRNWAPFAFSFPLGYVSRTDSNRGGVVTQALPSWFTPLTQWQWYRIPGSCLQVTPWNKTPFRLAYHVDRDPRNTAVGRTGELALTWGQSGCALRNKGSWLISHGGGHNVSVGNPVLIMQINSEKPQWQQGTPCSNWNDIGAVNNNPATSYLYTPDGILPPNRDWRYFRDRRPVVGHTGYKMWFDQTRDIMLRMGSGVPVFGKGGSPNVDAWRWDVKDWEPPVSTSGTQDTWLSKYGALDASTASSSFYYSPHAMNPATGEVYVATGYTFTKWRPNPPYGEVALARAWNGLNVADPMVVVPSRGRLYFLLSGRENTAEYSLLSYNIASNTWDIPRTPTAGVLPFHASLTYLGMVYEPNLQKLLVLDPNGKLYVMDPDTATTNLVGTTGLAPGAQWTGGADSGVFTRFQYVPEMKACVFMSGANNELTPDDGAGTVYVIRTSL